MTDLPQLQQALVGAARRRNRRARARSALVRLAALVAVIIAAATAFGGRDLEREFSAVPPSPSVSAAREAADRFAVLRDESRLVKPSSSCRGTNEGPGSQTYLMRRQGSLLFCATVGEQEICTSTFSIGGGGQFGCMEAEVLQDFAEGRLGVAAIPSGDGELIYAFVPDGTRDARLTYRDGTTESVPIDDNFLGVVAGRRPATVSWTTPDGERFTSRP